MAAPETWRETTPRPGEPPLVPTRRPIAHGTFLQRALIVGLGLLGTAIIVCLFLPF